MSTSTSTSTSPCTSTSTSSSGIVVVFGLFAGDVGHQQPRSRSGSAAGQPPRTGLSCARRAFQHDAQLSARSCDPSNRVCDCCCCCCCCWFSCSVQSFLLMLLLLLLLLLLWSPKVRLNCRGDGSTPHPAPGIEEGGALEVEVEVESRS